VVNRAGQAVLTTTALPPGLQAIAAIYSGDSNFGGSNAAGTEYVSPDVTNLVAISVGHPRRHGGRFQVLVRLRNVSGDSIPAPIFLALDGLSAGARLVNKVGVIEFVAPLGSPLALVDLQGASLLAPGGPVVVDLEFTGHVHFTPRVLAGTFQV
jgi:hypothetical protein